MKPELKGLAIASQSYDDVLQMFDQIGHVQSFPEKLEGRMSEKKFIAAVELLQEAFEFLRRPQLKGIGALGDLRTYFSNQETSLTDILIEELHDHLYLKSVYCRDRWKPPASEDGTPASASLGVSGIATWEKPVYQFLSTLDLSKPLTEDACRNPESDTFYYIHLLIEALHKMGNLETAVDRIEQRLPVELFAVVDKTGAEVDARYPKHARTVAKDERASGAPTDANADRGHVLSEFLWNLYAKFEAIAEGHRVMHDVVRGIVKREGNLSTESLKNGFQELWKLYQSEVSKQLYLVYYAVDANYDYSLQMRSLLHDYLTTDGADSFKAAPSATGEEHAPSSIQRDKSKASFNYPSSFATRSNYLIETV